MNLIKTGVLFIFLTCLLLITGALIGGGDPSIVLMFLLIAMIMNLLGFWFSDKMVLSMTKAKIAKQDEMPELHNIVDEQSYFAGIPKPKIFLIDSDSTNAFATGRNKKHASIAVTKGILKVLNRNELAAVIAHELAHIGNKDTLIMTMVAAVAGAITMIAWMAQWSLIFGGLSGRRQGGSALSIVPILIVIIVMPLAATLVRLAISRTREFQADRAGALTSGDPISLSEALLKIHKGNQRKIINLPKERLEPVSHLFIVNPLNSLRGEGLARLFSTHPPIEERVRRLKNIQEQQMDRLRF